MLLLVSNITLKESACILAISKNLFCMSSSSCFLFPALRGVLAQAEGVLTGVEGASLCKALASADVLGISSIISSNNSPSSILNWSNYLNKKYYNIGTL